jgi:putative salt-induced outer membrane protein YdiY
MAGETPGSSLDGREVIRIRELSALFESKAAFALVVLSAFMSPVGVLGQDAQDEEESGWFYNAELNLLFLGGNSSAQTFGLGGDIKRAWGTSEFSMRAGSLRTKTGKTIRTAIGSADLFTLDKSSTTRVTAENYFLTSRYDRSISDRFFVYGGAGWERNTFAGFDSRFTLVGGVGNTWAEDSLLRFKTDVGFTFTSQNDVVDDPTIFGTFPGLRISWDLERKLTRTTTLSSVFIIDESLRDTKDIRTDFTNALTVDISGGLALKMSLRLLFDNQPSVDDIPLEQPLGTLTGETVLVPLNKLDTVFTVAFVASF